MFSLYKCIRNKNQNIYCFFLKSQNPWISDLLTVQGIYRSQCTCIVLTGYLYGRRLQKTIGYSSNLEDTAIYREYLISKTSTLNVALFCQHNFVYLVTCAITYVMKSVCVYDTIITFTYMDDASRRLLVIQAIWRILQYTGST
jgi:hypothetical protein